MSIIPLSYKLKKGMIKKDYDFSSYLFRRTRGLAISCVILKVFDARDENLVFQRLSTTLPTTFLS